MSGINAGDLRLCQRIQLLIIQYLELWRTEDKRRAERRNLAGRQTSHFCRRQGSELCRVQGRNSGNADCAHL